LFLPNDEEHCPSGEVLRCAASSGEENEMKKLLLISAAVLISTSAFAQTTVVTTTGTGHSGAVQIEPEYRTKIRSYVTEHKIRPVETREKIVVGSPVPRDIELEAVPTEWGPSLTKYRYVYSGERVMLVDPETRAVIQEVE
jgi:mRNA-degrading endonuclease toxin of MazEF toxin-antitoxin module